VTGERSSATVTAVSRRLAGSVVALVAVPIRTSSAIAPRIFGSGAADQNVGVD
jgi:hypothetical protein